MKGTILVIGGYGNVGKHITQYLALQDQITVIVAGRNLEKAKKVTESSPENLIPLYFDIHDASQYESALDQVDVVISTIEVVNNISFVNTCLQKGIHYTEIATSFETMSRLLPLHEQAISNHTGLITGAGLMPGLFQSSGFLSRKSTEKG